MAEVEGGAKAGRKHRTYSKEFKLRAIKMKLEEGYSNPRILAELGIPEESVLRDWVRRYRAQGEAGLEERRGNAAKGRPPKKPLTREEELLQRIRRLEMENAVLKKLDELMRRDAGRK